MSITLTHHEQRIVEMLVNNPQATIKVAKRICIIPSGTTVRSTTFDRLVAAGVIEQLTLTGPYYVASESGRQLVQPNYRIQFVYLPPTNIVHVLATEPAYKDSDVVMCGETTSGSGHTSWLPVSEHITINLQQLCAECFRMVHARRT